jgi:hypothetical protein
MREGLQLPGGREGPAAAAGVRRGMEGVAGGIAGRNARLTAGRSVS